MASIGPFVYSALPDKRNIRLLKLLSPADNSLFVRIQTMITSLDHPESIPYSALSYTWGHAFYVRHDPSMPKSAPVLFEIECNGKLLKVGENLYQALIRLRDVALAEWYWIDAICINQGDLAERSSQVQIMGEIYATAKHVIVWVGEADEHSDIALPILEHLWDDVVDGPATVAKFPTYLTFNDPRFYEDIKRAPLTTPQWEAIAQFFTRRWFKRLWILQELVLANNACILCGGQVWDWDAVLTFGFFLHKSAWWPSVRRIHAKGSPIVSLGYETLVRIQRLSYCRTEGPNKLALERLLNTWTTIDGEDSRLCAFLVYLLDHTRPMSASDSRDKIYAILPLATWYLRGQDRGSVQALPAPDYEKPVPYVYGQFTEYLLQHSNGLSILSWCDDIQRRRLEKELPSWVPDFSTEMLPLPLIGVKPFNATLGWHYVPPTIDPSKTTVTLMGICFDHIEELSEHIPESIERARFLPLLDLVSRLPGRSATGFDRLEVLMRTLLADKIDESGTDTNKSHFPFDKVSKSFVAWLNLQMARSIIIGKQEAAPWITDANFMQFRNISLLDPSGDSNFDAFLAEFLGIYDPNKREDQQGDTFANCFLEPTLLFASMYDKSIWVRRLARTKGANTLCLTAPSVEPGDQVWFLRGGRVPFVLKSLQNGNYLLRGEAYVHGLMDGEIFAEGVPLKDEVKEVCIE